MNMIETYNLSKYYGKIMGIQNLNMEVKENDIFGFIGPNGAGKTTTIKTLLNFLYPTSGTAKIFGLDIIKQTKEIKKNIGYLSDGDIIYKSINSYELLEFTSKMYKMKYNDFKIRLNKLSDILELDLKKKIKKLSRGNRKKLFIIRSMIHRPKLLILDEPTAHLDPLIQNRFFDILRDEHKNGTTVFFSSHILNDVQNLCNKVAIIKNGKIIKAELLKDIEKNSFKRISIELTEDKILQAIEIEGIKNFSKNYNKITFLFDGNIGDLMKYFVDNKLTEYMNSFLIEKTSLDTIFLNHYENER